MSRPVPVVLDVDTGTDDALALLLAARHPGLDLRAVTCVAGNVPVELAVRNTLAVLEAAGRLDVPVAAGPAGPARAAAAAHGRDGLADLGLPASTGRADPRPAATLLADVLTSAGDPVTVAALGPLTNLAALARRHPAALARAARLVVCGGAPSGDAAAVEAEFNLRHDAEAAAAALTGFGASGVPVTVYGMEVFRQVAAPAVAIAALERRADAAARLAAALLRFRQVAPDRSAPLGDAGAVCTLLDAGGVTIRPLAVRVELTGRRRGELVEDQARGTPVDGVTAVDAGRLAALWQSALTS